jgi:hypothetical protein
MQSFPPHNLVRIPGFFVGQIGAHPTQLRSRNHQQGAIAQQI